MLGFHSSFLQNLRCKGQYMHITTCPTHPNGINDSDMKVPQFQKQVTRDTLKCNAKILMTPLCKQTHLYINITLHYRFKTGCTIIKRHVWTRLGQTAEVSANFHFIPAFLMPSLRKKVWDWVRWIRPWQAELGSEPAGSTPSRSSHKSTQEWVKHVKAWSRETSSSVRIKMNAQHSKWSCVSIGNAVICSKAFISVLPLIIHINTSARVFYSMLLCIP